MIAATRKNRITGAKITAQLDDFLGWVTVCETHGGYAEHASKTQAMSWISQPWVYCEKCGEAK
jgi:hypothetical protein